MPKTWHDLFVTDSVAEPKGSGPGSEIEKGFFKRLRDNLSRSREALAGELRSSLFQTVDDDTWLKLEEALILADVGAPTTAKIVGDLELKTDAGEIADGDSLRQALEVEMARLLEVKGYEIGLSTRPTVICVVGVNGTGKTTTIGKLAWHLHNELNKSVLIAAADTYRAAATEQLGIWADRADAELITGNSGSDPAAVAFEAVDKAKAGAVDVVICDTAGRLHTDANLMDELAKIERVLGKAQPGAPHESLLVIDATTGQNGLRQAKLFREHVNVTGVCLTKLDGSAKGGIALAIANELSIPIKLIGIGEALEDLRPFDGSDFARALLAG